MGRQYSYEETAHRNIGLLPSLDNLAKGHGLLLPLQQGHAAQLVRAFAPLPQASDTRRGGDVLFAGVLSGESVRDACRVFRCLFLTANVGLLTFLRSSRRRQDFARLVRSTEVFLDRLFRGGGGLGRDFGIDSVGVGGLGSGSSDSVVISAQKTGQYIREPSGMMPSLLVSEQGAVPAVKHITADCMIHHLRRGLNQHLRFLVRSDSHCICPCL